ncbi:hypothetical protein HY251_03375 [bacterium]|nr:hypothetical protein [bacterium]
MAARRAFGLPLLLGLVVAGAVLLVPRLLHRPSTAPRVYPEGTWETVAVGSTFEFVSGHSGLQNAQKWTLTKKEAGDAYVRIESDALDAYERRFPLSGHSVQPTMPIVDERDETITVPAGTFACYYMKCQSVQTEGLMKGMKETWEIWLPRDLPVSAKAVLIVETGSGTIPTTTTTVLTKVSKR